MTDQIPVDEKLTMDYYGVIRDRISSFDDLAAKVTIEGTSFSIALLGLSGVVIQSALGGSVPNKTLIQVALAIALASIVAVAAFTYLAIYYSKLLGAVVEVAEKLEDRLIAQADLKLSKKIDETRVLGLKLAGKNTWLIHTMVFVTIMVIQIAVSVSYYLVLVKPA